MAKGYTNRSLHRVKDVASYGLGCGKDINENSSGFEAKIYAVVVMMHETPAPDWTRGLATKPVIFGRNNKTQRKKKAEKVGRGPLLGHQDFAPPFPARLPAAVREFMCLLLSL